MHQLLPADLVIVSTLGPAGWVIRFGEMLQGKPDLRNHVAMFHHTADGVNWYLEGRPGGVGWKAFPVAQDSYLGSSWTVTNFEQPKTAAQRQLACSAMRQLLGAPYDWEAIAADTASALRLPDQWAAWGDPSKMPGHVVCSSSAAWAYRDRAGLAAPVVEGGRLTEPADWDAFIMAEGWKTAAA